MTQHQALSHVDGLLGAARESLACIESAVSLYDSMRNRSIERTPHTRQGLQFTRSMALHQHIKGFRDELTNIKHYVGEIRAKSQPFTTNDESTPLLWTDVYTMTIDLVVMEHEILRHCILNISEMAQLALTDATSGNIGGQAALRIGELEYELVNCVELRDQAIHTADNIVKQKESIEQKLRDVCDAHKVDRQRFEEEIRTLKETVTKHSETNRVNADHESELQARIGDLEQSLRTERSHFEHTIQDMKERETKLGRLLVQQQHMVDKHQKQMVTTEEQQRMLLIERTEDNMRLAREVETLQKELAHHKEVHSRTLRELTVCKDQLRDKTRETENAIKYALKLKTQLSKSTAPPSQSVQHHFVEIPVREVRDTNPTAMSNSGGQSNENLQELLNRSRSAVQRYATQVSTDTSQIINSSVVSDPGGGVIPSTHTTIFITPPPSPK